MSAEDVYAFAGEEEDGEEDEEDEETLAEERGKTFEEDVRAVAVEDERHFEEVGRAFAEAFADRDKRAFAGRVDGSFADVHKVGFEEENGVAFKVLFFFELADGLFTSTLTVCPGGRRALSNIRLWSLYAASCGTLARRLWSAPAV